jgi:predicted Zn-dependent protease
VLAGAAGIVDRPAVARLAPAARLAAALGSLSCAVNPVSGRPEVVLVSTEQERRIGLEEARKVEESVGLVADLERRSWIEAIGARLAAHSPRQDVEYRFYLVDLAEPNAFALPGGHVYVSRGLLALVNREDELAGVIGHEIGHVAARHSVRRLTVAAPFALALGIPALLTGIVSPALGDAVAGLGGLAGGLVLARYSREQEREADRIGLELAARAGWDPAALPEFLETLEREEALARGGPRRASWLDSHPATPERIRDTERLAAGLERAAADPIAGGRERVLARLEGLLVGDDPAEGIFEDGLFLHPELDFALRFPEGFETRNGREVVAAVAPDGRSLVALQLLGPGDDPREGVRADRVPAELEPSIVELSLSGVPAARLVTRRAGRGLVITWVAWRGLVYRVTGACPEAELGAHRARFEAAGGSFRPLRAADRARIRELRLAVHAARSGESLGELVRRSQGAWSVEETAIANRIAPDATLAEGELLKLPVAEPYRGRSGA